MKSVFAIFGLLALCVRGVEDPALELATTIPLSGVEGRFDHFAVDAKGARLFVAALGNNTVETVDLAGRKRIFFITGQKKPCGVLYLAESNALAVANGDDGTFRIYSVTDQKLIRQSEGLDDADNLRRDAKTGKIYLGYGSGALAVLSETGAQPPVHIQFQGHPEAFQLERDGARIFVNVPDTKQVLVIDREKRKVVAHWPLGKLAANFPMALDEMHHRLFIGCRRPACLVVLNTDNGQVVATLPIVGDTDDLFYDAKRQLIYIAGGEGFIDVVEQKDADTYTRRERISTAVGARTAWFIPERDEFCLAVPHRGVQPAELRIYRTR